MGQRCGTLTLRSGRQLVNLTILAFHDLDDIGIGNGSGNVELKPASPPDVLKFRGRFGQPRPPNVRDIADIHGKIKETGDKEYWSDPANMRRHESCRVDK